MSGSLRDLAISEALAVGFHRAGVCGVAPSAAHRVFLDWLAAGRHGEMDYLEEPSQIAARADANLILPGVKSAIVVALSHEVADITPSRDRGVVARYARGNDYHHVMRSKLRSLGDALRAATGLSFETRACVDSAPLLERDLAVRAGLGFIGKNTMLIIPGVGSYVMLGVLLVAHDLLEASPNITTAAIESRDLAPVEAERETGRCGTCRACLDACPTNAFLAPFDLDAKRCISYLTIEARTAIPESLRAVVGNRIFGCDACQSSCPYNRAAPTRIAPAPELTARDLDHAAPVLATMLRQRAGERRRFIKSSALGRASRLTLSRNVLVALANARLDEGDTPPEVKTAAFAAICRAMADDSAMVREHAAWALGTYGERGALSRARRVELDPDIVTALDNALAFARTRTPGGLSGDHSATGSVIT